MKPGGICFHGFNFHVKWRETSSYLESDSFYHFEEGIEKAPYNDFRDIVIQSSAYGAGAWGGLQPPLSEKK